MTRARAASTIAALAALAIAATGGSARAALTDTAGVPVPTGGRGAAHVRAQLRRRRHRRLPSPRAGCHAGRRPGRRAGAAVEPAWPAGGPGERARRARDRRDGVGRRRGARRGDRHPRGPRPPRSRVRRDPAAELGRPAQGPHRARGWHRRRHGGPLRRPRRHRHLAPALRGCRRARSRSATTSPSSRARTAAISRRPRCSPTARSPIGGVQSVDQPLGVHGLRTGTSVASRFTDARGMPAAGAEERTLTGVQEVVVRMPPAKAVTAILESGARTGATASLAPATDDRLAAATTAFGFTGTTPTDAERRTAIGRIAAAAPERQIWDALDALDTADLAAAHAAGTQLAPLVSTMRARGAVPAGVPRDASADVTVVLQNSETYVSRGSMRLAAGGSLRVQVVNRDGFARRIERDLPAHVAPRPRPAGLGHVRLVPPRDREDTAIPAGGARIVTLRPRDDAFAVWLGDPGGRRRRRAPCCSSTAAADREHRRGRRAGAQPGARRPRCPGPPLDDALGHRQGRPRSPRPPTSPRRPASATSSRAARTPPPRPRRCSRPGTSRSTTGASSG